MTIQDIQNTKVIKDISKKFKIDKENLVSLSDGVVLDPSTKLVYKTLQAMEDGFNSMLESGDEYTTTKMKTKTAKTKELKRVASKLKEIADKYSIDLDFLITPLTSFYKNTLNDPKAFKKNHEFKTHLEMIDKLPKTHIIDYEIKKGYVISPFIDGKLFKYDEQSKLTNKRAIRNFMKSFAEDVKVFGDQDLIIWPQTLEENSMFTDTGLKIINLNNLTITINIPKLLKNMIMIEDKHYLIVPLFDLEIDTQIIEVLNSTILFNNNIEINYEVQDQLLNIFDI